MPTILTADILLKQIMFHVKTRHVHPSRNYRTTYSGSLSPQVHPLSATMNPSLFLCMKAEVSYSGPTIQQQQAQGDLKNRSN